MIEIPEATTLAEQAARTLTGRTIVAAEAGHTPHKLTWFSGDPGSYGDLLAGLTVSGSRGVGGHVQLEAGDVRVLLSDGAVPRWYAPGERVPDRHQLRLDLDDASALVVTIAMYGGVQLCHDGEDLNRYYEVALAAPSPLTAAFDEAWFGGLLDADDSARLSMKALLATGQRIPGLGNGVLQDILWAAALHPRRTVRSLSDDERAALRDAVVGTLRAMTRAGGRDTERDLFGRPGGYATVMSRLRLELPCPRCGGRKVKETYLGGAVYYCAGCQLP